MNTLIALIIFTANILCSFNDPFEFQGDYADEVNPIRQKVFEEVVSKGTENDREHGPTLSELVTPELLDLLAAKQAEHENSGFTTENLNAILLFIEKYSDQKMFQFMRNNPSELLSLDKILRDNASRSGKLLDLPILSSTYPLNGQNSLDLKRNLLEKLFTAEIISSTKSE
jgi:hypothetical protein